VATVSDVPTKYEDIQVANITNAAAVGAEVEVQLNSTPKDPLGKQLCTVKLVTIENKDTMH